MALVRPGAGAPAGPDHLPAACAEAYRQDKLISKRRSGVRSPAFILHDVKTTKHRTPGDQLRSAKALPKEYTTSATTILFTVGALSVSVASMDQNTSTPNSLELAVDLVSAYVSHNPLPAS